MAYGDWDVTQVGDLVEAGGSPRDEVAPGNHWAFDADVTRVFDDMLQRSIPNYDQMRRLVTDACVWHARQAISRGEVPLIVDVGCSRGAALEPVVTTLGAEARYVACDISDPMLAACRSRFEALCQAGVCDVRRHDLRTGFPAGLAPAAAVLSVLTLQFVPIEYRQRLLREIYLSIAPGGILVLVEKVLGATSEIDRFLVDTYYELKRDHGYSDDAIDRKRFALEGVLVPLTATFNEQLVTDAGFEHLDCCWAWANFRAWVALKR